MAVVRGVGLRVRGSQPHPRAAPAHRRIRAVHPGHRPGESGLLARAGRRGRHRQPPTSRSRAAAARPRRSRVVRRRAGDGPDRSRRVRNAALDGRHAVRLLRGRRGHDGGGRQVSERAPVRHFAHADAEPQHGPHSRRGRRHRAACAPGLAPGADLDARLRRRGVVELERAARRAARQAAPRVPGSSGARPSRSPA